MEYFISNKQIDTFIMIARDIAALGLVRCSSGNLSMRIDENHMLVTESGSWMAELEREQAALCRIEDGVCLNNKTPSIETGFHRSALKTRKDINYVLHFQSPFATALACRNTNWNKELNIVPEVPSCIGAIAVVPYMLPGSAELSEGVSRALENNNMVVLENHGQVTVGRDHKEIIKRAVFFEFASEMCYRAGKDARLLESEKIEALSLLYN